VNGITIYEFDALTAAGEDIAGSEGLYRIPGDVYAWLEDQCLRAGGAGKVAWLRLAQRSGRRVVQVNSFVGVIRAPNGFQIEVLPKVGRAVGDGVIEARRLLIEMLRCLRGFHHLQTGSALISATHMPLLEVFIAEFLRAVEHVVKRGLRGDYSSQQENLFAMRGKLLMAPHLRQNLCRADRFFVEHDEYSIDRPENRLLHSALKQVTALSSSRSNQQLARELGFVFADVPESTLPYVDFQKVRMNRGMAAYAEGLAWARLILDGDSPLTGVGARRAPSLLFPMERVFEAFVARHLDLQLRRPLKLKTQSQSLALVRHVGQDWFRLKPDMLVKESVANHMVLDTKWKLLDGARGNGTQKYGLSQSDFYQLYAYGQSYLDGRGDVVLVFPKTDAFRKALPMFEFSKSTDLRLWVLPFCLNTRKLVLPLCGSLDEAFFRNDSGKALGSTTDAGQYA